MEWDKAIQLHSPNRRRFDGTLYHINQFGSANRLLQKGEGTQLQGLSFDLGSTKRGDDNHRQFGQRTGKR